MLGLTLAPPALAQVPPLAPFTFTVRYDIYWNGLALGRIRITTQEDAFAYSVTIDTKTRGIAALFDKQKSIAQVRGSVVDGQYIPIEYRSQVSGDEEPKKTVIRYDETGAIAQRTRTPKEDPNWRPVVPLSEANTATDPITGFIRLRKTLHSNMIANIRTARQRTYEGARLAEFSFHVVSRARSEVMGHHMDTINMVPKRMPINGYTPKEKKKFAEKNDPSVHVYFSADGRFIPVLAEAHLMFGTISARLTEIE